MTTKLQLQPAHKYAFIRLGNAIIFEWSGLMISLRVLTVDILIDLNKTPVTNRFICESVEIGASF